MEKPRVVIIFHGWLPSERAAGLWAGKVAEGFGKEGFDTMLLIPRRRLAFGDAFEKYRLERTFSVEVLPALDLFDVPFLGRVAFFISALTFAWSCYRRLRSVPRDAALYANDPHIIWLLSYVFKNSFYELHVVPTDKLPLYRALFARMRGFVAITAWGKEQLERVFRIPSERILVAPGGVAIGDFDISVSKEAVRAELGLPRDTRIALYTGHLYGWKGAAVLAEAARLVPDADVIFVGGTPEDTAVFKRRLADIPNVRIVGYRPHEEIPLWQKAADVLVLPNTATKRISKYNTSPMKLFEYMASGTPIVASDLPSVREVLSEETAILVEPDSPRALARGIAGVFEREADADARAKRARLLVEGYSWGERAHRIADFMRKQFRSG